MDVMRTVAAGLRVPSDVEPSAYNGGGYRLTRRAAPVPRLALTYNDLR